MKQKILYLAAIIIGLSIISGGTFAYFTAEDTARNEITTGGVAVEVVEQQVANGELLPYSDPVLPIMPGTSVSKIVSVQSTEQAAWVRMSYTVALYDKSGNPIDVPAAALSEMIVITPNTEAWALHDGWWYCNTAVQANETTAPLFETVAFSGPNMGNEYQGCTVQIHITAQAVQQANNGHTVTEAVGWPET